MRLLLILAFTSCSAKAGFTAPAVTSALEQRTLVEALSGAAYLGVGGLPTILSHRFSDSPEIHTAAAYLRAKYARAGIDALTLEYNPMDVFPYYVDSTDRTYRAYFRRLEPILREDFDGYCAGTLEPDRARVVAQRLERVGLSRDALCFELAAERVEKYIRTTIRHTVDATRRMLQGRSQASWPNVVAVVPTGQAPGERGGPRPLCVVGAHMDSVARDNGGRGPIVSPGTLAPGADDNGSGTAAVLTLARAARDWVAAERPLVPCDLAFVHFSGEEEGLLGSLAFVHLQMARPALWMINFDMIGYRSGSEPSMNVGYDRRFGRAFAERFAASAQRPSAVLVERETFLYSSDQISYWDAGIPALAVSEEACSDPACRSPFRNFNPRLHTPGDVVAHLDFDYAAAIVNQSFDGLRNVLTSPADLTQHVGPEAGAQRQLVGGQRAGFVPEDFLHEACGPRAGAFELSPSL